MKQKNKGITSPTLKEHQPRPFVDLLISIIIPSFILMKLSNETALGPTIALITALAFPFGWGLYEFIKYKKFNFVALLGLISVLLTGGIGLLKLDSQWLAVKEAAIPATIGLIVLVSAFTPFPLIKMLIYNRKVLDVDLIKSRLRANENITLFEKHLLTTTYLLSGTFFFSAVMNYFLAKWIVTSPSGSSAFNEELGQMTLYSYPVIAIPSMLMTMAVFYYLWRTIKSMTGLSLSKILRIEEQ